MKKKSIRTFVLTLISIILILFGLLKKMDNYFGYIILALCILQGVQAIFDYALDLPMNVGTARILDPIEKNKVGRAGLLIVAIALMIFAIWWLFYMPL
jgi:hypothetical protein